MTSGYMLEVRFMIDFNYLQCVPRNTFAHNEKPRFVYSTKLPKHWWGQWQQSENMCKYYGIERGGNNVHFASKHVSKNEFWVHTCSLGFWVKLRFAK
jgi:hypothetical protein